MLDGRLRVARSAGVANRSLGNGVKNNLPRVYTDARGFKPKWLASAYTCANPWLVLCLYADRVGRLFSETLDCQDVARTGCGPELEIGRLTHVQQQLGGT